MAIDIKHKIEGELVDLAHEIIRLEGKIDVYSLKEKAKEVYEKATLLNYIHRYAAQTIEEKRPASVIAEAIFSHLEVMDELPSSEEVSETESTVVSEPISKSTIASVEIIEADHQIVEEALSETVPNDVNLETSVESETLNSVIEEENEEVEEENEVSEEIQVEHVVTTTEASKQEVEIIDAVGEVSIENKDIHDLEELLSSIAEEDDFKDALDLEASLQLLENVERVSVKPRTINDVVAQQNLQIDLNDRIAFVKHLFKGNQDEFNRIVGLLNQITLEKEAKSLLKVVKQDYDWTGKEVFEERFVNIIERKFS